MLVSRSLTPDSDVVSKQTSEEIGEREALRRFFTFVVLRVSHSGDSERERGEENLANDQTVD